MDDQSLDDAALVLNDHIGDRCLLLLSTSPASDAPRQATIMSQGPLTYDPHSTEAEIPPGPHGLYRIGTAAFSLDLPRWTVLGMRADPFALTLDAPNVRLTMTTLQPQAADS